MKKVDTQIKIIQQAFDDLERTVREYNEKHLSSLGAHPLSNRINAILYRLSCSTLSDEAIKFAKQKHSEAHSLAEKLQRKLDKYESKLKVTNTVNPTLTDEYTDAVLADDTKTINRLEAKARNALKSQHTSKQKHDSLLIPVSQATSLASHWGKVAEAAEDSSIRHKIIEKNTELDSLLEKLKPLWSELNQLHFNSHFTIPDTHLSKVASALNSNCIKIEEFEYYFKTHSRKRHHC